MIRLGFAASRIPICSLLSFWAAFLDDENTKAATSAAHYVSDPTRGLQGVWYKARSERVNDHTVLGEPDVEVDAAATHSEPL